MRKILEIPPFRAPRPIIRLINSDSQIICLIVALWAATSALAVLWIFAL